MEYQVSPGSPWQLGSWRTASQREMCLKCSDSLCMLLQMQCTRIKVGKFACKMAVPPPQPPPRFALYGGADAVTGCKEQSTVVTKLRDQRYKVWPLRDAFHLTSHHLLGFIRLHISIILHHLLQPCLATCHLCRIKGICVVLQNSQLEEGKDRKWVKALSAFTGRWKAEFTMSSSSSSHSGHREPKPTSWQPYRALQAADSFPGTGTWLWKCSSLCPES